MVENSNNIKKEEKSSWVIGGATMIGLGVGFIFLQSSVLIFVASIIMGVGAGLIISPVLHFLNR